MFSLRIILILMLQDEGLCYVRLDFFFMVGSRDAFEQWISSSNLMMLMVLIAELCYLLTSKIFLRNLESVLTR